MKPTTHNKTKKRTVKAWAILWHDVSGPKIDYADAKVNNDCPSVQETDTLAIYETKKDAISHNYGSVNHCEYEVVPITITYHV